MFIFNHEAGRIRNSQTSTVKYSTANMRFLLGYDIKHQGILYNTRAKLVDSVVQTGSSIFVFQGRLLFLTLTLD